MGWASALHLHQAQVHTALQRLLDSSRNVRTEHSSSKARWCPPSTVHNTKGPISPRAALGVGEVY